MDQFKRYKLGYQATTTFFCGFPIIYTTKAESPIHLDVGSIDITSSMEESECRMLLALGLLTKKKTVISVVLVNAKCIINA